MGYQLWISPNTGIRRKGTTFKELQKIFIDQITTRFIYEPVYCCRLGDQASEVRETLIKHDFDVVGVMDESESVIGYCIKDELQGGVIEQYLQKIKTKNLISDSTAISHLFTSLLESRFLFVLNWNKIDGIVTIADVNKPIVRIYLFGVISLFELHLNYWINYFFQENSWASKLNEVRINAAKAVFELRRGNNMDLTLLECLQICDKKVILNSSDHFRKKFGFSKRKFEELVSNGEKIRNELTHSQDSIISNIEWRAFVSTIKDLESFLKASENEVEIMIKEHLEE